MPDRRNYDNERIEPQARVEETLRPFAWYISDYALERLTHNSKSQQKEAQIRDYIEK